jgi:hypothetical protein
MYEYAGNPLYNPMVNPYLGAQRPFQQQPRQEVVKVSGENGARAFQMPANSSALLLDESGVIVWLVTTDGAGYKTVAPFDITPHEAAPAPDFGSLEARISRLEERVNAATGNSSNVEQQRPQTDPADRAAVPQPQQSASSSATNDAAAKSIYDAGSGLRASAWE